MRVVNGSADLGTVRAGITRNVVFEVKNMGTTPVTISGVRKSCSCSSVTYDYDKDTIAPGKSGAVRCKVSVEPRRRSFRLFLAFSNGEAGVIAVAYDGIRRLALGASRVDWGGIVLGKESAVREVAVYGDSSDHGKRIALSHVGEVPGWLRYDILDANSAITVPKVDRKDGTKAQLAAIRFWVTDRAPTGTFSCALRLRLAVDDEVSEFGVECTGKVGPELYATLGRLVLVGGDNASILFRIKSVDNPFAVKSIQTAMGRGDIERLSDHETQITFTPNVWQQEREGMLVITLDHPTCKEVTIPIVVIGGE
jgi:hypothetical protein